MKVVIAGAGLAAQRCCATLRRLGHDGPIVVLGDEPRLPYDRPPLSKQWLAGEVGDAALELRALSWYAAHDVDVRLGAAVVALDHRGRTVTVGGGGESSIAYDRLVIATGARPRRLPGCEGLSNLHVLRGLRDASALRERLVPGARLLIVGAGFIGLEVAATARVLGVEVTLLDTAPVPLAAIVGPRPGAWFASMHAEEGVRLAMGTRIGRWRTVGDRICAAVLSNGEELECDAVLAGVGVAAATQWLRGTPLESDGIAVDASGASAVAHVYAAGDAARPLNIASGRHERCDHWEAAARMGVAAAHGMLGLPAPAPAPQSFWSDQYGTRIQLLGDPRGADDVHLGGDPQARDFSATYLRDGVVVAGLLAGRPHALPELRAQLGRPIHERNLA